MDFSNFPPVDEPLERLDAYREERRQIEEALSKAAEHRTVGDWNIIARAFGSESASGCGY